MADVGIKIRATDEASGVFGKVAAEAGKLQGAVASAGSSFAAMGSAAVAGLSVLSFASKIKDAIDLADSFNKLSQKTGIAVEDLSKLNYAAGLADVSTEALATGMRKLNVSIAEAAGGNKEKVALFNALGVSFKDASGHALSADKVFSQLSETMSKSGDGAEKVNVGSNLMGKGFEGLIPLVNSGAKGLADMGDEAKKLGIVMGADFAKNAEEFNDNLHRINVAGQGLVITLAGDLVKGLGDAAREMAQAAIDGGKLAGVIEGIQTLLTGTDQYKNDKAMVEQTEILFNLEKALNQQKAEGYAIDSKVVKNTLAQIEGIKEELRVTQNYRKVLQGVADNKSKTTTIDEERRAKEKKEADRKLKEANARLANVGSTPKVSEYQRLNEEMDKQAKLADLEIANGVKLTESEKYRVDSIDKITNSYIDGKISADEWAKASTKALDISDKKRQIEETDKLAKANLAAAEAHTKFIQSLDQGLDKMQADTLAQQESNDRLGLSKTAIAELDAAKLESQAITLDLMAIKVLDKNLDEVQYNIYKQQAAELRKMGALKQQGAVKEEGLDSVKEEGLDSAKATFDEWKRGWEETDRLAREAFTGWAENGTSMAEAIGKSLKKALLSAIYEATLKPLAFQLYTSIAGNGGAAGGATGTLGQIGSASSGYNALAGAGGLFASSASYGAAIGTTSIGAGSQAAMLAAQTGTFGAEGAAMTAAAAGNGAMSALMTAAPYALAAMAVYSLLKKDFVSASDSGRARIDYSAAGVGGAAYSTTGSIDQIAGATKAVAELEKTYLAAAKSLGVSAIAGTFEAGYNSGAGGAHPNTVIGANFGKSGYSSGEVSSADTAAVQLAASRAVFAALQGSDLPGYLAQVFNGITADTATQEQISNTMAYAQSLKTLRDTLAETRTPLEVLQANVASGFAALGTSAETFKRDFVAAIDSGISPENLAQWQTLGTAIDGVAESVKNANANLAGLQSETGKLQVELLKAQGKTTEAIAAQRALDTKGYTEVEIAAYAFNETLRAQINVFKEAADAASEMSRVQSITNRDRNGSVTAQDVVDATGYHLSGAEYMLESGKLLDVQLEAAKTAMKNRIARESYVDNQRPLELPQGSIYGGPAAADPTQADGYAAAKALAEANTAAAEAAKAAAAALATFQSALGNLTDANIDLQAKMLALQGDTAGAYALTRTKDLSKLTAGFTADQAEQLTAQYDANKLLSDQIDALTKSQTEAAKATADAANAAEQIKNAWKSIGDSLLKEVDRIRGVIAATSSDSYAALESRFAIATAQARAGDQTAAGNLTSYSGQLSAATIDNAGSRNELVLMQSKIAQSLSDTAAVIGSSPAILTPFTPQAQTQSTEKLESAITSLQAEIAGLKASLFIIQTSTTRTAAATETLVEELP